MLTVRRRALFSLPLVAAVAGCGSVADPPAGAPLDPSESSRGPSPSGLSGSSATATSPVAPAGSVTTLARDLAVPWGIAFLPDGRALVGERDTGRVVLVGPSGHRTIGVVAEVYSNVSSGGEAGLLGLALRDGWLYAYHSTTVDNRVVRLPFSGGTLGKPRVVLSGIRMAVHHNGGGLRFAPDGTLFASTGDAEDPASAQDTTLLNGKILHLTPTGGVPVDNPWGNPVWSRGHRNVEGLAFDPQGRLWASEFGDKEWDELNRIVRGGDYGWPAVQGSDGPGGYRDPFVQWPVAECSPSGLAIAQGRAWLGALQGQCVWSVDLRTRARRRHLTGHGRLRLVAHAPDGSLWVGTSNRDGRTTPREHDDRLFRLVV